MKILITGGAGFIGSHLADRYLDEGHEVIIVDNLKTGKWENLPVKAKFYLLDIGSPEFLSVMEKEKPDIVNHHAAQASVPLSIKEPLGDAKINALGFLHVLECCAKTKVKKVIFISSGGAIYGEPEEYPATENCPQKPLSLYAIHKSLGEHYLYFYKQTYGLDYTILRYANVYGPRQDPSGEAGVVSIFVDQIKNGITPTIFAFEEQPEGMLRDYLYVKDAVYANVLALKKGSGEAFNIGTGTETSTAQLYAAIAKELHYKNQPLKGPARPGDLRKSCLSSKKAQEILKWQQNYSLEEGIKETVNFFYT